MKFDLSACIYRIFAFLFILFLFPSRSHADEWPTFRGDNRRSAISTAKVDLPLHLNWVYKPNHRPTPAWPLPGEERPRMHTDLAHHAVMDNEKVYFGTSVDNLLMAIDRDTGGIAWRCFAEGSIRFAPTLSEGRVFFGSDDGHVTCLDSQTGRRIWRYRPGPSDEKVIGNGRMVSLWPVRTSVLVEEGVVYFGAGVFPHEGIYVTALDAADGSLIWKNDTLGDHAHEIDYGGISPQGYLISSKTTLYVPSGRAMPAAFNKETGEFLYFCSSGGKVGGSWALIHEGELIAGVDASGIPAKVAFDAETGRKKGDIFAQFPGLDMVVTDEVSYTLTENGVVAIDREGYKNLNARMEEIDQRRKELSGELRDIRRKYVEAGEEEKKELEESAKSLNESLAELSQEGKRLAASALRWSYKQADLSCLILSGSHLFVGGEQLVLAVDISTGGVVWEGTVEGTVMGLAASEDGLVASLDTGEILAFRAGKPDTGPAVVSLTTDSAAPAVRTVDDFQIADKILDLSAIEAGFCLVLGAGEGRLAQEIAETSDLQVVALEADEDRVAAAKNRLLEKGLYGARVIIEPWSLESLPDFFANLIVSEEAFRSGEVSGRAQEVARLLRPFGGVVVLGSQKEPASFGGSVGSDFRSWLEAMTDVTVAPVENADNWFKATRGRLKGAGKWTHLYADPQNTACSGDEHVKSPVGVLWYGEPGSQRVIDRHGRATGPLSMNGRLFVQGDGIIRAYDAYNGTFLWKREIPGAVRVRVDVDCTNLALTEKGLYVAVHNKCLRLNLETGKTEMTYELPPADDGSYRRWGYIGVVGNRVIGTRAYPLRSEYGAIWEAVTENGKWKKPEEIPEEYQRVWGTYLSAMVEQFPEPNHAAWEEFHRKGFLWYPIDDYPEWTSKANPTESMSDTMKTSDAVFALDEESGELVWIRLGQQIAHITMCIGKDTLFFTDSAVTGEQRSEAIDWKKDYVRTGRYEESAEASVPIEEADIRLLTCLDLATGEAVWERPVDFTGCGGDKLGFAYQEVQNRGFLLSFGHFSNHDRKLFKDGDVTWRRVINMMADTGEIAWSKPLNYLRRPAIVGENLILEPRTANLCTGEINMRTHPITGEETPFEFLRPGHSCGITTASMNNIFYRSYCIAMVDIENDGGLGLFGGIRPGCWVNMITANGLLMFPESSAGCTCSFPMRTTIVMKTKDRPRPREWTVFISQAPIDSVQHFSINLGAPGDMRDEETGAMWFGYPRPKTQYGVQFDLKDEVLEGTGYFAEDFRGVVIEGTKNPWLFTNGCVGLTHLEIPLVDPVWEDGPARFTIRLGFCAPPSDKAGDRVFSVALQGTPVLKDFEIRSAAGGPNKAVVKEFTGISVEDVLRIDLAPLASQFEKSNAPLINFVEAIRETPKKLAKPHEKPHPLEPTEAEKVLQLEKVDLDRKELDLALEKYHAVFDAAPTDQFKKAALEGMAQIGHEESLPRLAPYARNNAAILWNYEEPDPDLRLASTKTFLAIADKFAQQDVNRALQMFRNSLSLPMDGETRMQVVNRIDQLGAPIDQGVAEEGYLTRWWIIGPFPWDEGPNNVDKNFIGEPEVSLSDSFSSFGGALSWEPLFSTQGMIDLEAYFERNENVSAYAYAEFELPESMEINLRIGSDNGSKCWFNGDLIGQTEGHRLWKPDQDLHFVTGAGGVNRLLIKVYQRAAEWAFSVRLTDREGNPIPVKRLEPK